MHFRLRKPIGTKNYTNFSLMVKNIKSVVGLLKLRIFTLNTFFCIFVDYKSKSIIVDHGKNRIIKRLLSYIFKHQKFLRFVMLCCF